MTAQVIPLRPGGRGRGVARVVAMSDDLVEPWMEVKAVGDASADFADVALALARGIQRALAKGNAIAAATLADELEQIAPRVALRARVSTAIALERLAKLHGIGCVDAIGEPGHGHAA